MRYGQLWHEYGLIRLCYSQYIVLLFKEMLSSLLRHRIRHRIAQYFDTMNILSPFLLNYLNKTLGAIHTI